MLWGGGQAVINRLWISGVKVLKPYYEEPGITIYHGDCREILPQLPKVDLVLTDPPYGVHLGIKPNNQRFDRKQYTIFEDTPENVIPLVNNVLEICFTKTNRIVFTPGTKNIFNYKKPDHVGSFFYPSASGCNSWGFSCWQPIFYYGKDPYSGKGSRPDSFMSVEASEDNGHPCPKPINQWSKLLDRTSLPGEVILDPFMGSGTTLRAAKDLGRKAIGIEIEEKYCEIAVKRLAQEVLPLEFNSEVKGGSLKFGAVPFVKRASK